MTTFDSTVQRRLDLRGFLVVLICIASLFIAASRGFGDEPASLAPPVANNGGCDGTTPAATSSSVFNWHEVPVNRDVPIERAAFDKGGYQLTDSLGETIVVPFHNNNLYVMKFAQSPDGTTYFVNTGSTPILYLPESGYLANTSDPGGIWHPFTAQWHPQTPVFVGIAPSWNDYAAMQWYPSMVSYGGYWRDRPFLSIGATFPALGLFFSIGGQSYPGWGQYESYYGSHPSIYPVAIVNQNLYRWGGSSWHQYAGYNRPFFGSSTPYVYGHGFIPNTSRFRPEQRTVAAAFESRHGMTRSAGTRPPLAHQRYLDSRTLSITHRRSNDGSARPASRRSFQSSHEVVANHAFRRALAGRTATNRARFTGFSHSAAGHGFSGGRAYSDNHRQQGNRHSGGSRGGPQSRHGSSGGPRKRR